MPITLQAATRIAGEFSCLPFYANWDENAVRNIAEVISEICPSETFALRLAGRWIRGSEELPTPKGLIDLAAELREAQPPPALPSTHCPKCYGTGYHSVSRNGYDYAHWCSCPIGQRIRTATLAQQAIDGDKRNGKH